MHFYFTSLKAKFVVTVRYSHVSITNCYRMEKRGSCPRSGTRNIGPHETHNKWNTLVCFHIFRVIELFNSPCFMEPGFYITKAGGRNGKEVETGDFVRIKMIKG